MIKKILKNPNLTSDEKAEFERLVKANMKRAYYAALGFLGSHDLAMDISQDAFIRAYRSFKTFDNRKNFYTWYYRILKNLCLNYFRDSQNKREVTYLENIKNMEDSETPGDFVEEEEVKEKLERAMQQLKLEDREILILKEFQNFSYKEIAELLNLPIGTVMSKLYYARKKLANEFERLV